LKQIADDDSSKITPVESLPIKRTKTCGFEEDFCY